MNLKLENIPVVIMACFVLHNVCELHNDNIDFEVVREQMDWNKSEDNLHKISQILFTLELLGKKKQ